MSFISRIILCNSTSSLSKSTFLFAVLSLFYISVPCVASLLGQLYFREIAYLQAKHHGEVFEQTPSPVCVHVPWLPTSKSGSSASTSTSSEASPSSSSSSTAEGDARLAAWEAGKTGYPYIDACMRQLKETGECEWVSESVE